MMTIHATKKLMAKLPVNEAGLLPLREKTIYLAERDDAAPSPLGSWHANLLTLQRRNCVLLVHDQTRFPVFIPALKKADLANLDWWFSDALMNTLLKCGANDRQMALAAEMLHRLQVDSVCDRSVQGTMNRMASDIEHMLYYDSINLAEITGYRLSAWLAHRPCSVKGRKDCVWPDREFFALLDQAALSGPIPDNVISLDAHR
ncbi:MAG: hypothetical protein CMN80_07915 [Spongiibacter sp.]|uniref:DUF6933 domain-containing protein n=1 Tax=Spongiibacter TaxID=630749 RepID=UPI0003FA0252|nr:MULTISPECIES: hypothetical protein [Spongiibacter]MAK44063.1 hypothetical protein [Spongiibacter sp.]|tara:strand:+ start:1596 stop:2204 length:609 start_codon:yes stop_codon:yes gene_type:complete